MFISPSYGQEKQVQDVNQFWAAYLNQTRLRYNFLMQFPLGKKAFQPGTLSFVLHDELHINFGKEILYNTFDQNRFFAGFNYHLRKSANLQFGYMNVFLQQASGNQYRSLHAPRIFFFQNLDFRKKEG